MNEKSYIYMLNEFEKELKELMGEERYREFSTRVAKEAFRQEVLGMAEGDFKKFCLENFDKITE